VECWHMMQCSSMTMSVCVRVQLLALEHCWSISTRSCLTSSLQPWPHSEQLPSAYLPEELVWITMLQ
jgi:hypothetical protein